MLKNDQLPLPGKINPDWKIGLVYSCFYEKEVRCLVEGAKAALFQAGIKKTAVSLHPAFGSFEIPLIGSALAKAKKVQALIGLGIIVKGDTKHADLLASAVANGLMDIQLAYQIPFAFEVLFVDSLKQAQKRCGQKGNKGAEAALAVLHTLSQLSL